MRTTRKRRPDPKRPDYSELYSKHTEQLISRARKLRRTDSSAYLTLTRVGPGRKERQLARMPKTWRRSTEQWVEKAVFAISPEQHRERYRLRLWGAGGTPHGGVMFSVSYPAVPETVSQTTQEPPQNTALLALQQALQQSQGKEAAQWQALQRDLAALSEQHSDVEERVKALEAGTEKLAELALSLQRKQQMIFETIIKIGNNAA